MNYSFLEKKYLQTLGISDWGYTEESIPRSLDHFDNWIKDQKHLPLDYLSDHRASLRKDIKNFFPSFQSALVFLFPYKANPLKKEGPQIASYALGFEGKDYHYVLAQRLHLLGDQILKEFPGIEFKLSLDIHPVLERDLAYRSGLGWFGKNSMFISREQGSFFLIGSLLLSNKLNIEVKKQLSPDHCGTCRACIDACPTKAIDTQTRTLKAQQCISTYTIEIFKEDTPVPQGFENFQGEVFGCDICQDVCPWNRKIERSKKEDLGEKKIYAFFRRPISEVLAELESMSNKFYRRLFSQTSFERLGRVGMMKNLKTYLRFKD